MLLLVLLFALHTFLLMGTGTWSDLAMTGEDFATTLYYVREGMLAAGFLLYAAYAQWKKSHPLSPRAVDGASIVLLVVFVGCIVALQVSNSSALRVPAVLAIALIVGVSGGMVYERIALSALRLGGDGPDATLRRSGDAFRMLGIIVGCGGALAVALQFVLQTGFSLGGWLNACFVACFALLIWFARKVRLAQADALATENTGSKSRGTAPLACIIVAAACLFALLPFYEVVIRATGAAASFYEWHRLFLAVGYIAIGAAAYLGGRSAASVAIMVSALFAIIVSVQTAMMQAGPLTAVLFYFLLGAALAWSCIMFMAAAAKSSHPALVASLGRVLVALVTLSGCLIQAAGELSLMVVLTSSLVLLAAMVIAMAKGGFFSFAGRAAEGAESPREEPVLTAEERTRLLARECGLTDREEEVLAALVLTEKKNQQIADDLGVSRRQLQTHVSRIYEKTGTTTRAGLVMRASGEAQAH